jgi:hypothetical protein
VVFRSERVLEIGQGSLVVFLVLVERGHLLPIAVVAGFPGVLLGALGEAGAFLTVEHRVQLSKRLLEEIPAFLVLIVVTECFQGS